MQTSTVLVTSEHLVSEARQILQAAGMHLEFLGGVSDEQALVDRLAQGPVDAILLRGSKPITARVLGAARGLKIIAKNGAGVDSIDLADAARRNICVAVAPGANAHAVAEHAVAMMLALVRDLGGHDRRTRKGDWQGSAYQGRDFAGSVVGIVGFGSIGRNTARMVDALGGRVLVFDLSAQPDRFEVETEFDRFLSRVDILSLHCPLTKQTRGLVGPRELGLMRAGSFIVNTARGGLVDEQALAAALASHHLAGAGLDSFAVEPIEPASPLLHLDNIIFTPHVAGVTRQAALEVATTTARNIVDFLEGRPLPDHHVVRAMEVAA